MGIRTLLTNTVASLLVIAGFAAADPLSIAPLTEDLKVKVVLDQEEHHFAVVGGCNTLMGRVHVTDSGAFRVKQGRNGMGLSSTLMACPDDLQALDDRLSKFILMTPKVVRNGDSLFLVGTVEGESHSVYLPIELDKGSYLDIKAKPYEQVFYYVSAVQVPCEIGQEEPCLQVKQEKDAPWTVFKGDIEGFTPIENYEYRLRLKEYKNEDGSTTHTLDMVVEQGLAPITQ